jgi:hypothetical protein
MCGYISESGDILLSIHMSPPSPRLQVEAIFPSPCWGVRGYFQIFLVSIYH